jgi:hypothetical protein
MLAFAAISSAATAQPGLRWQHRDSGNGPLLAWEKPDTDDQPFALACNATTRHLRVSYLHKPDRQSGDVPLELSAEGGRVQLTMRGERVELNDMFVLSSETRLTPELARVLTQGRTLTLRVRGRAINIPLAGSAEGVAALMRQCGTAPTA